MEAMDETAVDAGAEETPVYLSNCDPGDEIAEPAETSPLAA